MHHSSACAKIRAKLQLFSDICKFYTKYCHCTIAELHIILCRWMALYNIIYYIIIMTIYLRSLKATLLCNFAILRERAKKNKKLCKKVAKKFAKPNFFIVPLHQISKSIQTATLAPLWRHSREYDVCCLRRIVSDIC